jgi:amino acid transporter
MSSIWRKLLLLVSSLYKMLWSMLYDQSTDSVHRRLPLPGAIPQYCARYADPALGFAAGWNNWYQYSITLCAEISAAALLINFWDQEGKYNPAIWITIIIVLILALNIFAVGIYGEAEFIFASIKIITMVGLLILGLIIMLGGAPDHDRRGFRYWKEGAMKEYVGTGNTGRFTGLWSTLVNAAFSYGGVEMVCVAAGEAADPRRNIPKAVRRVVWVSQSFARVYQNTY